MSRRAVLMTLLNLWSFISLCVASEACGTLRSSAMQLHARQRSHGPSTHPRGHCTRWRSLHAMGRSHEENINSHGYVCGCEAVCLEEGLQCSRRCNACRQFVCTLGL